MFPEKIYIYRDGDGSDEWLVAEERLEKCAVLGTPIPVGVYKLEAEASVSVEVKVVAL